MSKSEACPKRVAHGHHWRHAGPYRRVCEFCDARRDSMYARREDGEPPIGDGTSGYEPGLAEGINKQWRQQ
jgi:hypothetical protein